MIVLWWKRMRHAPSLPDAGSKHHSDARSDSRPPAATRYRTSRTPEAIASSRKPRARAPAGSGAMSRNMAARSCRVRPLNCSCGFVPFVRCSEDIEHPGVSERVVFVCGFG